MGLFDERKTVSHGISREKNYQKNLPSNFSSVIIVGKTGGRGLNRQTQNKMTTDWFTGDKLTLMPLLYSAFLTSVLLIMAFSFFALQRIKWSFHIKDSLKPYYVIWHSEKKGFNLRIFVSFFRSYQYKKKRRTGNYGLMSLYFLIFHVVKMKRAL